MGSRMLMLECIPFACVVKQTLSHVPKCVSLMLILI